MKNNLIAINIVRSWIYDSSRGYCNEQIRVRTIPQSIGCSKNFSGPEKLTTKDEVSHLKTYSKKIIY